MTRPTTTDYRTVTKRLRLTPAEAAELDKRARESGDTWSQYVRRRLLYETQNQTPVTAFCSVCGKCARYTPDPERDGELSCASCGAEL